MSSTDASERDTARTPWQHPGIAFGALGLLSGCLVVAAMMALEVPAGALETPGGSFGLWFGDVTLWPGLIFGIVIGGELMRRRLASYARIVGFVLASIAANFAATNLAMNIIDAFDSMIGTGVVAGLFGAACLAAAAAALLPFARRWPSCVVAIAAGCVLGATLAGIDVDARGPDWLFLYGPWQAGFAAALFATAPRHQG